MPIHAFPSSWIIETQNTGYAIGLNEAGFLTHRYWRSRLPFEADYPPPVNPPTRSSFDMSPHYVPEEYPGYSALRYIDPAIKITMGDGARDLVPQFLDYSLSNSSRSELVLRLVDKDYPVRLSLHYRVYEEFDLIARWVAVENLGDEPILLERVFSAKWTLPHGDDYFFNHMYGRHLDEFNIEREPLTPGLKVVESRRLTTSHHHSPWFAIDRNATEDSGEVWFGTLAWSGNWKITAEVTEFASTRISIGINDWDFAWKLNPAETFVTPEAISGFVKDGFGAASRRMHDYVRETILPHKHQIRKVLYNSWEATTFNVDETSQSALAEIAAAMGVELFVMDDGWFQGRVTDNAGLGDWWPDSKKFPQGLGGLIRKVNSLGMEFGLWVEPEMVNPDSALYQAHPDWVIHFPERARTEARQQLILNLGRPDVQEYILDFLTSLLSQNNIRFIKWDMNRNVSEPGWSRTPGEQRELWVRYVQGLYRVWGMLCQRFPDVIWQSCSGGGGRADYGILQFTDQIWVSDNTEATARLRIQNGFSQFLPTNTMEAWVTDWGREVVSIEFAFHVSMCGLLGVGGNLNHWNEVDRELAARCIAQYKEIRSILQEGDQYRLISPQKGMYSAVQYVTKDHSEAVLFVFRVFLADPVNLPTIYLRGLEPEGLYCVDGFPGARSGASWMEAGLRIELRNLESKILRIKQCH